MQDASPFRTVVSDSSEQSYTHKYSCCVPVLFCNLIKINCLFFLYEKIYAIAYGLAR